MRGPPPKIVPWTSLDEWRFVRDGLFHPTDDAMQQFALEIATVWISKGRVPTAVEATVNLIQVARVDAQTGGTDSIPMRLAYSAAITRFVNETVDPRQGGANVIPITRLAEQVGLPRVLVDLRHESVHDALPTMSVFRYAVEEALAWLWKSYWVPQSEHDELLTDRITIALQRTVAALKVNGESAGNIGKVANRNMVEVEYLHSSAQVVTVLCELLLSEQFISEPLLLDAIVEMYLLSNDATDELTSGCILMADAIIKTILQSTVTERCFKCGSVALFKLLRHLATIDKPFTTAMQILVTNPSERVIGILEQMHSLQKLQNQMISQLYLALRQRLTQSAPVSMDAIRTIEDVKKMAPAMDTQQYSRWTIVPNWRPCPLGTVPGYNPSHDFMSLWQPQPMSQ